MKHICAQPIMKFYHRKYMLQKNEERQEPMSSDAEMLELELIMVLTDDILILIMARTFTKSMIMIQIFGQHDAEMLS